MKQKTDIVTVVIPNAHYRESRELYRKFLLCTKLTIIIYYVSTTSIKDLYHVLLIVHNSTKHATW